MSSQHLLVAVVLLPILGAAFTPIIGRRHPRAASLWAISVMTLDCAVAARLILQVALSGPIVYPLGGWAAPYGIELRLDEFGAAIGVVCLVGWLALVFSYRYAQKEVAEERIPYYYALFLLNLGGMIGFLVTGDLFNLFVFLEILSLSGYALVAVSGERLAEMAAFKYLVLGAVSSLSVLLATGFLYGLTGTLNMADMTVRLRGGVSALPAAVALSALVLGFSVKAAIFPLHVWLPDAHAMAPSPVSAVLSGLVVKVGVLGLFRTLQIYHGAGLLKLDALLTLLTWLGAISIVLGAFFAIFQEDIKMMLAYSTVSNIGYIFMGIGLASPLGLMGAAVHIFNHAIIKATLFLAAGAIIYRTGFRNLSDLRGVGRSMPWTFAAMAVGAVSIVGIPPTAGFLCKWYIALGAIQARQPLFAVALLFGALFIFIYYIRMVNAFYFREPTRPEIASVKEAPLSMLLPMWVLAGLCLVMGVLGRIPLVFIEPGVKRLLAGVGG